MYCHIRVDHLEKIQKEVIEFIIKKQARSFKIEGSNAFCTERSLSYPIRKSSMNNTVLKLDRTKIESFVGSLFFNNPIWDIELQKMYLFNSGTKHTRQETKSRIEGLPDINICPCSTFFDKFNSKKGIVFKFHCQDVRYETSEDIIQHIKNSRTSCYYHAIIFDIIQYLYPKSLCHTLRIKKEDPYKSCIKRTDISISNRHLRPITNPELSVHTWDRDITKNANWFCVKTKIKEEPGFEFMVCNIFKKKMLLIKISKKKKAGKNSLNFSKRMALNNIRRKGHLKCILSVVHVDSPIGQDMNIDQIGTVHSHAHT